MDFHYFGYGSNMLTERLRARCPSARPISVAEVAGYSLEFSKRSVDCSGKATLRHLEGGSQRSFGVVFEIALAEREALDSAEGVGSGYERRDNFTVRRLGSGEELLASCYLATNSDRSLKPYDWYLALAIAGAIKHDLNAEYIATLKRTAYIVDQCHGRSSRNAAIEALRKAGFGDYRRLFPKDGTGERQT